MTYGLTTPYGNTPVPYGSEIETYYTNAHNFLVDLTTNTDTIMICDVTYQIIGRRCNGVVIMYDHATDFLSFQHLVRLWSDNKIKVQS